MKTDTRPLEWAVHDDDGDLRARFAHPEDAASLIAMLGDGTTIRHGRKAVWTEGAEDQCAAESYDLELTTRSLDWLHARDLDYFGRGIESLMGPVEPSRSYSHGRRFIPAWLAAERACAMALDPYSPGAAWYASVGRLLGYISPSDTTVIRCPIPRPA